MLASSGTDTYSLKAHIRNARSKFAAMAGTYFVGVFNDNFFKQTALLMAIAAGKESMQGYATIVFTLPFLIFAAQAGWCADRFSKRSVVIAAKTTELTAMIFGALGVFFGNWFLILLMLGIEGVQATIFSPALNGSIPELYPPEYVITANALIKMVSTGAILAGIAAAGFVLDIKGSITELPLNHVSAAAVVVGISIAGVIMSFGVAKFPAASPHAKFPWQGPFDTLKVLYNACFDPLLAIAIGASTFFWFIGSLNVLVLNELGLSQFKLSNSLTSGLVVAELLGIAVGGLLCIYLAKRTKWHNLMVPAASVMAVCMMMVPLIGDHRGFNLFLLFGTLVMMGLAGGVFIIPVESFIQIRPAADRKGATLAAANFAAFGGILISGPVLNLLNWLQIAPSRDFAVMGVMTLIIAICLFILLRKGRANG